MLYCSFTVSLGLHPQFLVTAHRVIRRDFQSGGVMVLLIILLNRLGIIVVSTDSLPVLVTVPFENQLSSSTTA
jgi:hypothetical protein